MGLQKQITGPFGLELNYHKINRVIFYFDGSGNNCIQMGSYLSREASQQDGAIPAKVWQFPAPEFANDSTVDQIKALTYNVILEKPEWADSESILEEGQGDE